MNDLEELGARGVMPRSWPYCIRVDGRAFSAFTRRLDKPFDGRLTQALDFATHHLIGQVDGAVLAYAQSDEVSILVPGRTDGNAHWFGSRPMKIASVAASEFTAAFNAEWFGIMRHSGQPLKLVGGTFDARVFPLPGPEAVVDYLNDRRRDAYRNAVTQIARQYASHKQLHGLNRAERVKIIEHAGDRLDRYAPHVCGRYTIRESYVTDMHWTDREGNQRTAENVTRHRWVTGDAAPVYWAKLWKELTE